MPPPAFLQLHDIVKSFDGHRAVDRVSIDIARGEIFALLGSSGCGKTTLLRVLAGFETPTAGRIVLDGRDLAGLAPYERPLNMMFQSYALFPHLTVAENIAFGLQRDRLGRAEIAERVDAMLALVQLQGFAKRKPHQLSGGQQQRVALARSLAKKPQLLLLDEPLGALDRKLREATQLELVRIVHEVGVTCVMVTHDQEEAMTMATRIAVMSEGRFLQVGAPAEIYERPATRFVADFIGDVNLIEATVEGHANGRAVLHSADGRFAVDCAAALEPGATVTLALRPEKVRLLAEVGEKRVGIDRETDTASTDSAHGHDDNDDSGGGGTAASAEAALNHVRATVVETAYFGRHTVYRLRLASGALLKASSASAGAEPPAAAIVTGDTVWAEWPASAPVLLNA